VAVADLNIPALCICLNFCELFPCYKSNNGYRYIPFFSFSSILSAYWNLYSSPYSTESVGIIPFSGSTIYKKLGQQTIDTFSSS